MNPREPISDVRRSERLLKTPWWSTVTRSERSLGLGRQASSSYPASLAGQTPPGSFKAKELSPGYLGLNQKEFWMELPSVPSISYVDFKLARSLAATPHPPHRPPTRFVLGPGYGT